MKFSLNIKKRLLLGGLLASIHAYLVFQTTVAIHAALHSGKVTDWPMLWIGYLFLDFPISLVWFAVSFLAGYGGEFFSLGISPAVGNYYLPLFFVGFVGTCWWFFLPSMIALALTRFKKKRVRK